MSVITLRTNAEFTWLEIEGQSFFITPNHDLAEETCLRCVEDLEFLRETVKRRINAIKYQSDDHVDVKNSKIDKLERALHKAGVPNTQYIGQVKLHGIDLTVGYEMEREDLETGLPPCLTVMSVTHCGKDMVDFISRLGGDDVFEEIANLLDECPEDDE